MKVKKVITKKECVRFNTGVCLGKQELLKKIEKELNGIPETAIFQNVYVGGIAILERKTVGKEINLKYSKLFKYEDLVPGIMTAGQFKRLKARGVIQAYTLPEPNTPGQYFINLPNRDETGAKEDLARTSIRDTTIQRNSWKEEADKTILDTLLDVVSL